MLEDNPGEKSHCRQTQSVRMKTQFFGLKSLKLLLAKSGTFGTVKQDLRDGFGPDPPKETDFLRTFLHQSEKSEAI
ncbi:hypothetical protein [Cohaesibacter intestini]|uniref:hypothetical protein n=1 Tax=Cohaesibacter intestini TaxID=2211145 RepID=UPI0013003670|nr:hypothetical protein [Cohaesibacter intestini]